VDKTAQLHVDGAAVTVLRPWRATATVRGGRQVLEAPVGSFATWHLTVGSRVTRG